MIFKRHILKTGHQTSFINKYFITVLNKIYLKRAPILAVEKEYLTLVLPFPEEMSVQNKAKLCKALKRMLRCCKITIYFKSQRNLLNAFSLKDCLPCDLVSGVFYKFQCGRYNSYYYRETGGHLKVSSGENIGVSRFAFNKVKSLVESSIRDHLLLCGHCPFFDGFIILAHRTNNSLLEIKESL